jgi:hypothetical protein
MSYLYKRSNLIWHMLIRSSMTRAVWSPLVEWTRRRHVAFRERLERLPLPGGEEPSSNPAAPPAPRKRSLSVVPAGL